MNHTTRSILAVSVLSLFVSPVLADDWPRWMGKQMDGVWHESGIIKEFPENGATFAWRQPVGGGYGGPSVAGDRVFVMDRIEDDKKGVTVENDIRKAGGIPGGERVKCLKLSDGETIWEQSYDTAYTIAYPNGPRCTPAVDGDRVYTLGAMGRLMCIKVDDGEIVWKKDLTREYETKPPVWGYSSHPLIDGEMLFVPVGGIGTGVVAFDKMTGKELWRSVTTVDVGYSPLVIYSAEVEGGRERQLIFWHGEGVVSLDLDSGNEFWTVKFPEEPNPSITTIATPVIAGDKILISEFYKGSLLLQIESNPPSVKELWRSYTEDPRNKKSLNAMMATPAVKDGYAYGIGFNGRGQGVFRCVELESGMLKWSKDDWLAEKPITFATAFAVQNSDRWFLFSDTGELLIANISPEGFEEISRAKILEPTTAARGRKVVWCHPAFAQGKMIVRNDEEIVCVDLKKT